MAGPTQQNLIDLEQDVTHVAEVATGKAGGVVGGADITTSTNRLGGVRKTLPEAIAELEASSVRGDLANSTDPAKGAGLVGLPWGESAYNFASRVISPERFGAVAGGVVDCTSLIQDALDHISTIGSGTLGLSGIYKISQPLIIPHGCIIQGGGCNARLGHTTGFVLSDDVIALSGEGSITRYGEYSESIHIRDLAVWYTGSTSTTTCAIRLIANSYSTVKNVLIYRAGIGLGVDKIQDCRFENITISACHDGVRTISGAPSGDWMTMCVFDQIYTAGCTGTGFTFEIPTLTSTFTNLASDGNGVTGFVFSNLSLCTVDTIYTELNKAGGIQFNNCSKLKVSNLYAGVARNDVVSSGYYGLYTYGLSGVEFKNVSVSGKKADTTLIPSANLLYFTGGSTGVELLNYEADVPSPLISNIAFAALNELGSPVTLSGYELVPDNFTTTSTSGILSNVGNKPTFFDVYITGVTASADAAKFVYASVFKADSSSDGVITTVSSGGGAALTYVNATGSVAITGYAGVPQIKVIKRVTQ